MKVTKEEILDIIRKAIRDEKRRSKKEKILNNDEGDSPTEANSNHSSDNISNNNNKAWAWQGLSSRGRTRHMCHIDSQQSQRIAIIILLMMIV